MTVISTRLLAVAMLTVAVATAGFVDLPPAQAAARSVSSNSRIPIEAPLNTVFDPCTGELVQGSGFVHVVHHVTFDANGVVRVVVHGNAQGVSGVGLTSGMQYRATGAVTKTFSIPASALPYPFLLEADVQLIAPGPSNNLRARLTLSEVVNPDGTVAGTLVSITPLSCV